MVTKSPLRSRNIANICVAHLPSFTHILGFHVVFSDILISACVPFYNLSIMFFDHLYYIPSSIIALYFRLGSCMVWRKVQFLVQVHSRKVKILLWKSYWFSFQKGENLKEVGANSYCESWRLETSTTLFKMSFFVVHLFQSTTFRLVDSTNEIGACAIVSWICC